MYKRKTEDLYILMGNYGDSWDEETAEKTRKDIRQRLKEYQENTTGSFKIIKKRVKADEIHKAY